MIITVASGKGGTGKTSVAVSLVLSLEPQDGEQAPKPMILDCDAEEPNAALFLNPVIDDRRKVGRLIPVVTEEKCTYCGRCAEVCQYHAIAVVNKTVLVFPELCHGCGSCKLNCPENAIHEELNVMGITEHGWAGRIEFAQGIMDVGQIMSVPVIHELKRQYIPQQHDGRAIILDSSPGAACPVVESMRGSDFVLLVTEPTPFGLHDLRVAIDVANKEMGLPVGVVINRDGIGDRGVEQYCEDANIPILMKIPQDRRIAEAYSEGIAPAAARPELQQSFRELYQEIQRLVEKNREEVDR